MDKDKSKKILKMLLNVVFILMILLLSSIIIFFIYQSNGDKNAKDNILTYAELIKEIQVGNVEKIEMTTGSTSLKVKMKDVEKEKRAIIPSTQVFTELVQQKVLEDNNISVEIKNPSVLSKIPSYIFSILPTLIMVALFVMIFKMQGLGDKGEVYDDTERKTKVTFDDIAGLDEEKEELKEIVEFLKRPKRFAEMGAKIPKGILLYGKPGTGKTLIAKAIAGEADVPFISMSGSEFIEMFAGLGASRVRKLFDKARKLSPCIVFIDEIDAIGSRRTSNSGAESENNQTLNQLLVEMDGFSTEETIIVLAATNRPEMLDKALLRPGRFDRQVTIPAPDLNGREAILKIHSKDKKLADDVSLYNIAEDTAGFTGAELANILNEAAIIATKKEHDAITNADLDEAVKKVTVGLEKTSRKISDKDKKLTAYHEAGHAVLGIKLDNANDVQKVTIIPRGQAGGYNLMLPKEEKYTATKTELLEQIMGLLGGRVAEEVVFGEITTGAHNDFSKATKIARSMVTEYGMSSLGPVQLETPEGSSFLGRDYNKNRNFSDQVALEIDNEVRKIINDCYSKAKKIIEKNRDLLDLIASNLIEHETLTKEQIDYIAENGKMPVEEMLDDVNLSKLKEMAKAQGIKGYSSMNKDELKKALSNDLSEEEKKDD